jgi:hypothetical protein
MFIVDRATSYTEMTVSGTGLRVIGPTAIRQRQQGAASSGSSYGVTIDDFYAYMPDHSYIFVPTREMWPASSVNSRLPAVPVLKKDVRPSVWLDTNRPVEQMTWVPGGPLTIEGRLIAEGGAAPSRICWLVQRRFH